MNMIRIDNLTFCYPGQKEPTLKNVSLHIEKGDFVAIVGNNGCGKSTLCKTLNGLIPNFIVGDMEGSIQIDGQTTKHLDIGELAKSVGYVYQDFENQIVCPKVLDDVSLACLNYADPNYLEKGEKALALCGLEHKKNDYIWQMSGGQKHLLALAGATALSPDVLILDEPIAQLDPVHAKCIYEVLKDLNENHNKTIIVIEHHTEFIAEYCKHVILLKDGEVKWKLDAKSALRQVKELEASNIFPPQITMAAEKLKERGCYNQDYGLPVTLKEGLEYFESLECMLTNSEVKKINNDYQSMNKLDAVVDLHEVGVEYRAVKGENVKVMNKLSLQLHKGEKIALIGSNGAGKSTLMKLMIGLLKPTDGTVTIMGKRVDAISTKEMGKIVSLVYQNPEQMFIKDSIRKDIEYAMKARSVEAYEKRADDLLHMFHLTELAERDGRLLSGGQMRRASLAIGIALQPQILLLDEPTANLDIATRKEIMKTLISLKDVTETVLIATHDMQLVCDWATRIIVLYDGNVIADGTKEEIFANESVKKIVGIRPPEIVEMGQLLKMKQLTFTIDDFVNEFLLQQDNMEITA